MKKYIDTEWLENNAKEYSLGYYEEDEWATPLNVLDSAPSIDIVRCGECKYWHKNRKDGDDIPVFDVCYDFTADDFCSYGSNCSEKPNNSKVSEKPTGSERSSE